MSIKKYNPIDNKDKLPPIKIKSDLEDIIIDKKLLWMRQAITRLKAELRELEVEKLRKTHRQ